VPARFPFLLAAAALTGSCDPGARASCFRAEATPPTRGQALSDPGLGSAARDLAAALFDRDLDRAGTMLASDPALARMPVGEHHDMLSVAVATCEPDAVALLLRRGAPADGRGDRGVPLGLALMATGPELAHALLAGGASPAPAGDPLGPLRTAIATGSAGAVRMLLDFRADPDTADRLGHRPLLLALDTERFRIAEMLLDAGADPYAVDSTGGNLGTAAYTPMATADVEEAAAQRRLRERLSRLRWPSPPPSPAAIRALALDRAWPPAGVHAPPVPAHVLEAMGRVR